MAPALAAQSSLSGRVVRKLAFSGNRAIEAATLAASISTTKSSWFATAFAFRLLGLGEKRYLNEVELQRDVLRLQVLYKRSGYPDVAVDTVVRRTPENAYVTFLIEEGEPVRVTSLEFTGLDSLPPKERERLLVDLPIVEGDPFNRFVLQVAIDTIINRLKDGGYPNAEVFREFRANDSARTAEIVLNVVPGTYAVIGPVRVEGSTRVDSAMARKVLVTRTGREYRATELVESQRNLYSADLYRLASVGVDSARYQPGDDSVPLLVRVADARPRRIRGGLGFGTNDCLRFSAGITERDFLGGGRILDVTTRLSKIGVGDPFDFGLDRSICGFASEDTIGSAKVNYNVTVSTRRPAFLSPRNTATLSIYAERRSEFKVYLREEIGASFNITRETPRKRLPISLTYTFAYGRTEATPASFCTFLGNCTPEIIALQRERRSLATLTGTVALPRTNSPLDPTRGSNMSFEATHSSPAILSSSLQKFTRAVADAAWYQPIARDVVLSWRLRGGIILAPSFQASETGSFVPLEQRFYGGGPNDVRGFDRNELGPVVYVVPRTALDRVDGDPRKLEADSVLVAATGGNTLAVGNVELRFPSPIFASRLRLAAFVDAGTVWQRGVTQATVRVTPGFGFRVATPLGPARLDIAYNPHSLLPGPLFATDEEGNLDRVQDGFVLERGRKYTVHFSVGQPF